MRRGAGGPSGFRQCSSSGAIFGVLFCTLTRGSGDFTVTARPD